MLTCPTPWCTSKTIHTTTFINYDKNKETGIMTQKLEVEYSCPSCHVRTPKMNELDAIACWETGRL
jgi:hypothetical protein